MNPENRKRKTENGNWQTLLLVCLLPVISISQPTNRPSLDFEQPAVAISYRFHLSVSKSAASNLWNSSGRKYNLKPATWILNGEKLEVNKTRTRGKSSLLYPRKGLNLSFDEPFRIEDMELSKIALNNLAQDQNYWRNRFSYLLLAEMGVFPMFHQFATMSINGKSQGIFLLVEKTDSYTKRVGVNLLVRRDERGTIRIEYNRLKNGKELVKEFNRVEGLFSKHQGSSLFQEINQVFDLERYFRWLAINHILRNGDYTDEAFFYHDPETSNFKLVPWDYDDVFSAGPHETTERRNQTMQNRLLFSGEVRFDSKLDKNDFLYNKYLDEFEKTLKYLDESFIKNLLEMIYRELKPFYQEPEIITMSQYDKFGITNLEKLQADITYHYHSLLNRCQMLRVVLKDERMLISQQ